jgi:hypothetical protein
MYIGLYAYQTYGKKNTNANEGILKILNLNIKNSYGKNIDLDLLVSSEFTNILIEDIKFLSQLKPNLTLITGTTQIKEGRNVYNRAFVVKNKKILFTYDKQNLCAKKNYSEDEHYQKKNNERVKFVCGKKQGIFELEFDSKKDIGIEICRDNEYKSLKNKKVDLQIVMSCGCFTKPYALNNNGYLISVDGDINPITKILNNNSLIKPILKYNILVDKKNKNDVLYIYKI